VLRLPSLPGVSSVRSSGLRDRIIPDQSVVRRTSRSTWSGCAAALPAVVTFGASGRVCHALRVYPRSLTQREHALLGLILSVDFPGARELRAQLSTVEVVRPWAEGSASLDLRVVSAAASADGVSSPISVGALVVDDAGEPVGELLVWLADGLLAGLEYAWFTDDMPLVLPAPEHVRLTYDQAG
jgi:hypothetical protein